MTRLALVALTLAALAAQPALARPVVAATPDAVDALRDAMAARLALMFDVARFKWNHALPIVDADREAALLARATADAVARGLPGTWAKQVLAGQIAAARALQTLERERWQREQRGPFDGVPDLATAQRPTIDAATRRLIDALAAAICALDDGDAQKRLAATPPTLRDAPDAWRIAESSLWPLPSGTCPSAAP